MPIFFRRFIGEMAGRGHEVFVVAREKEFTCFLLDKFEIPYHRRMAVDPIV